MICQPVLVFVNHLYSERDDRRVDGPTVRRRHRRTYGFEVSFIRRCETDGVWAARSKRSTRDYATM